MAKIERKAEQPTKKVLCKMDASPNYWDFMVYAYLINHLKSEKFWF